MSSRLLQAAASTLGARLLSALLSFFVFAQVAAALPAEAGARVLFFSFAFGFVLASLRSFHLVGAGISGQETRSHRLRVLRAVAPRLALLALGLMPLTAALLLAQGVSMPVAVAGALLTAACAHDLDLPRAVVGRTPALPWLTAAGGVLGALVLLLGPPASEGACAAAFLLQWLPVAAYHAVYLRRLLWGRTRPAARGMSSRPPGIPAGSDLHRPKTAGTLLLSVFDGAILNAPFLLVLPLAATAAVDLALGNRLFIASLALFSLVGSWVISGELRRMALHRGVPAPALFATTQLLFGLVLGAAYALLYVVVAGRPLNLQAALVFVSLLAAYVLHATALRFALLERAGRARALAYAVAWAVCYAALLAQRLRPEVAPVVAAISLALMLPAVWMLWPLFRRWRAARS